MPTVLDWSTMLYKLALAMPTERAKRYYLQRADELQKEHDHESAALTYRNLVVMAEKEMRGYGE